MKKSEHTRDYIIEAAAPIFNKHGYAGTSLVDVLEHTGFTKGAIYHYFDNKDELALAALEYNLKKVSEKNFTTTMEMTHSCDKLLVFAEAFRNNYDLMKQTGGCPIMNAAVDSDDTNELMKKRICQFIKLWEKSLKRIIDNGKFKNEVRPDIDTNSFAINFISLIEGSLAMSKVTDEKKFIEHAVELIKSLIEEIRV
jgi:TetR/AcrR family transcriptional repressor of nem operon